MPTNLFGAFCCMSCRRLPPHPLLWPARQYRPHGQHRPRSRASRRPGAGSVGRAGRSKPSMSLLRRTHGHHRHLPACLSSPRTAAHGPLSRDETAMTRHAQSQPFVEAMLLRRSYHRACRLHETCIAASMTARRPHSPARRQAIHAFEAQPRSSISRLSPRLQEWRSSGAGTATPKAP